MYNNSFFPSSHSYLVFLCVLRRKLHFPEEAKTASVSDLPHQDNFIDSDCVSKSDGGWIDYQFSQN